MTWGPAQAGVASGVAVRRWPTGSSTRRASTTWCWWRRCGSPRGAATSPLVYANNRQATRDALAAGAARTPTVDEVLEYRDRAVQRLLPAARGDLRVRRGQTGPGAGAAQRRLRPDLPAGGGPLARRRPRGGGADPGPVGPHPLHPLRRRCHRCPPTAADPLAGWTPRSPCGSAGRFDLLLPTQEQVAVLAACPDRCLGQGGHRRPHVRRPAAVQDKVSATRRSAGSGSRSRRPGRGAADGLAARDRFPAFVKLPIGTASCGVVPGGDAAGARRPASSLRRSGGGRRRRPGARRTDRWSWSRRCSTRGGWWRARQPAHPRGRERRRQAQGVVDLPGPGSTWPAGAPASAGTGRCPPDAIATDGRPLVHRRQPAPRGARQRPRVRGRPGGCPGLALAAGAAGRAVQPPGVPGVRTHQTLLALLGAATRPSPRRAVVGELVSVLRRSGTYRGSTEELTPLRGDLRSARRPSSPWPPWWSTHRPGGPSPAMPPPITP